MNDYLKTDTKKKARERLILYVAISVLSSMSVKFAELTPDALSVMSWPQWVVLVISIVLPGLVTWRAFIDKTQSRVDQLDYEQNKIKVEKKD